MSGSCTWIEKCSSCKGEGKIQTIDKKTKVLSDPINCPVCEGTGAIMLKRFIERKKD